MESQNQEEIIFGSDETLGIGHSTSQILIIYVLIQALLGALLLEYAWWRTKRFRDVNEERDRLFPHFRRTDVQKWARWKFYPGAMLTMPTRIFLIIFICSTTIFICK